MLYPALRKEMINKIKGESIEGIKRSVQRTLYDWISPAPYTSDFSAEDEDDWDCSDGCRVMGIAYSDDQEDASYAALISQEGELTEFIKLGWFTVRRNAYMEKERRGKAEDLDNLRRFIKQKRPHVIGVGGQDMKARDVLAD